MTTMATPSRLSEPQRFLLLAVLIGVCTGLIVVSFHAVIELLAWAAEDLVDGTWWGALVPGVGAAAAALLVRFVVPAAAGSGIVRTRSALYVSNGHIPVSAIPGKFLACSLSIGTGTPLGPEDPSLLMGAGVASTLGRQLDLTQRSMRLVAPVGAAAGIAAAFNTPITGVLFVMEEVVASWDAAVLGSIVLASVSAVVTTRLFLGDAPLFRVPELTAMSDPREVLLYAALGVATGVFATVYQRVVGELRRRVGLASGVPPGVAPLVAGTFAGIVGLWLPEVLGTGYRAMDAALHNQYPWTTLALLGIGKLLVAAVAFGAGTPGGLFAPTLFLGVMAGGTLATTAQGLLGAGASPASTYVLAGMAGMFAGVFRAPMTAVFMVFELSATSSLIVPALITAVLGFLTARQLHHTSLLDLIAEDEGATLPSARTEREAEPLRVEHALGPTSVPVIDGGLAAEVARDRLLQSQVPVALVRLARPGWNAVRLSDLAPGSHGSIADHPALRPVAVTYPDEPLDIVLRRLKPSGALPVVSRLDDRELLGVLTLSDALRAYGISGGQATAVPGESDHTDGVNSLPGSTPAGSA